MSIGDVTRVAALEQSVIDSAQKAIKSMLQDTLDAMKTSAMDIPVYLVGGGSILAPDELIGSVGCIGFLITMLRMRLVLLSHR